MLLPAHLSPRMRTRRQPSRRSATCSRFHRTKASRRLPFLGAEWQTETPFRLAWISSQNRITFRRLSNGATCARDARTYLQRVGYQRTIARCSGDILAYLHSWFPPPPSYLGLYTHQREEPRTLANRVPLSTRHLVPSWRIPDLIHIFILFRNVLWEFLPSREEKKLGIYDIYSL